MGKPHRLKPAIVGAVIVGIGVIIIAGGYLKMSSDSRNRLHQMTSSNNLRMIGMAMISYENRERHYPAQAIVGAQGKPLLSWRVALLPYLDEQALFNEFHLDEPWDSEHNKKLIDKMPQIYENPSVPEPGKTTYLVPFAKGTLFGDSQKPVVGYPNDGPGNTIMILEADADRAVVWTKPDDLNIDPQQPSKGLGGLRDGKFMVVCADVHVSRIPVNIPAETLWALFTHSGGEGVDEQKVRVPW